MLISQVFELRPPVVSTKYAAGAAVPYTPLPNLVFGCELEIENIPMDVSYPLLFRMTEDGSLRFRGKEFISAPCYFHTLYRGLLKMFTKNNFRAEFNEDGSYSTLSNYSDRTSIHIHTNVQDLTLPQLATICLLYQVFERCLFEFVGGERDKNIFCVPWSETMLGRKTCETLLKGEVHKIYDWQKYTALNLCPVQTKGTIEWRHMPGTNDLGKITTWLLIITSIYKAALDKSFDEWLNILLALNTNSQYGRVFDEIFRYAPGFRPVNYMPQIEAGVLDLKYDWFN